MTHPNRVYFMKPIGMDGPIKIGCSDLPDRRLQDLSCWSPWPLELIGSIEGDLKDEGYIHRCFADHHSHREWFRSSPRLRQAIADLIRAGTANAAYEMLSPTGTIRKRHNVAPLTPERRKYLSCSARVRVVERKQRELWENVDDRWHPPADVLAILKLWYRAKDHTFLPAEAELRRLNEYLADPRAHAVVPPWRTKANAA